MAEKRKGGNREADDTYRGHFFLQEIKRHHDPVIQEASFVPHRSGRKRPFASKFGQSPDELFVIKNAEIDVRGIETRHRTNADLTVEKLEVVPIALGVAGNVRFAGAVPHGDVPAVYAEMDVAVFLSREESFGVSAVEAMSCSVPVIASDADGFREILDGGEGIIVPRENAEAAAKAMAGLAMDGEARLSYAKAGREKVEKCYRWLDNVAAMIGEYMKVSEKCAWIVNQ